jgi:hypothetical protein
MGQRKMPHTITQRGKRVAVVLRNGQVVTGKFLKRAKSNRWVEVEVTNWPQPVGRAIKQVRIPKEEIVSFSILKGPLDERRLGRGQTKNKSP